MTSIFSQTDLGQELRAEGLAEGLAEGRAEERTAITRILLEDRFGHHPDLDEVIARLGRLSEREMLAAIKNAASIGDL